MKILFIVLDIDYIDPLGIMLVSAVAKAKGHETHLGILSREDIFKKIEEIKPDIIAYGGSTGEHKYYFSINNKIKTRFPSVFTIMGGPHATFFPESINETRLDAMCVGEGEGPFAELLDGLTQKRDISRIQNIYVKGRPFAGIRPFQSNLDEIQYADRELFYRSTEMGKFPLKSFMASRGCPYRCTYCFNHAFQKLYKDKGSYCRRHSVDYVIEEVKRVKEGYPLSFVKFYDDIFVYKVDEWLEEFAEKYKRQIGLRFHCLMRANLLTEEIVKRLKDAGCFSMSISIEAASAHIRQEVLKRGMTEEHIRNAFGLCNKYDIKTFSGNMLGLPFSRIEDDIATVDLNIACKASYADFPIFHPYPKTELGQLCIDKGYYDANYQTMHMSYMNRSPLNCFTEREKQIQKNISELGLVVVKFPKLRNLILNRLIYLPNNIFFFLAFYFTKAYLVKTKLYPFKIGPLGLLRIFLKSFRLEKFKRTDERN